MKRLHPIATLGFVSLCFGTGCAASIESVPSQTTVTAASVPVKTDAAPEVKNAPAADPLTRDADLGGKEHHVSLLEGRLTFKIHATETPKIETASTSKGLLYSTLDAKVGDDQTIHCVAYADVIWPAGLVAADLRGEHDWANDGSEKADYSAKTTPEVTAVVAIARAGQTTIGGVATVRDEAKNVVAQRKVSVMSGGNFTFLCSDRSVGYMKRFGSFVDEAFASVKLDATMTPQTPKKVALYEIHDADGNEVGYRKVATFVDAKGVAKTFADEATIVVLGHMVLGIDSITSSTGNARGDETELRYDSASDGNNVQNLAVTHDAKGWVIKGDDFGTAVDKRLKSPPVTSLGPAWTKRVSALANATGKKAGSAKLSLFAPSAASSTPAIAKRKGDGTVAVLTDRGEQTVTLDADGVVSWNNGIMTYKRVPLFAGQK